MIKLIDGPADGLTIMLRRAPKYLRLVEQGGEWDALDQLSDQPKPEEMIYVYELVDNPTPVHLNRGRRGGSGWYVMATYRYIPDQPIEEDMRITEAWRAWCIEQSDKVAEQEADND